MAQRIKVALVYTYNKNWVAGAYYILNLVHALNSQEDKDKPELVILSHSAEEFDTVKKTGYPYLKFYQLNENDFWSSYNLPERIINKISRIFTRKNLIERKETQKRLGVNPDLLFPASDHIYFSNVKNKLFWIPDFQEHFLPQFFSEEEVLQRKTYQEKLAGQGATIVFSSADALKHFKRFYPGSASPVFVLPFAVTHPKFQHIQLKSLQDKYDIHRPYFFCPNQFWAHKNHITVLKAIRQLKEEGQKDVLVVFSGKEFDHRNPDFFTKLKAFVTENGIEENVRFLGFIDREDQLQLMNKAISVIQPSLFEGWSTVIEDAKSMSQFVIASALDVHKEQLSDNCLFFDPLNEKELAAHVNALMKDQPVKNKQEYSQDIQRFGAHFVKVIKEIIR